ncbi:MAG: STAS domain-containing protein [Acidimicrobiales bacterium]
MWESDLEIEVEPDLDGRVVVRVRGPLDLPEAGELRTVFADLCAQECPDVVLDLSEVSFIGSSGLGCITAFRHDLVQQDKTLLLRGASRAIRRAFEITHLDRLLEFEPAEADLRQSP